MSETLRVHQTSAASALVETFDLKRGLKGKTICQVSRRSGAIEFIESEHICSLNPKARERLLEDAKDALFLFDTEMKRERKAKLKQVPSVLLEPKASRVVQVPQVIVTLNPQGGLSIELPAGPGARRKIELREGEEGDTLRRVLQEQMNGNISIGQDGAPTRAQVYHWEHHLDGAPSPRCSFCLSEGLIRGTPKRIMRKTIISKSKDVEIRKIAPQAPKRKRGEALVVSTKQVNVEDLDL